MATFNKKRWWRGFQLLLVIYCIIGILLYQFQERIVFRGVPLPRSHQYHVAGNFTEHNIAVSNTDTINLLDIQPTTLPRKGVVVYLHGNRGSLERYASLTQIFTNAGYEVLLPDYPGYGKSTGKLSEEALENTGLVTQRLAASKVGADSIIVYGKSLGTGIASFVAANTTNKLLVLETPYSSMRSLFQHRAFMYPASRMSNYDLNTLKNLEDVSERVVIFHGTADGVIPLECAEELKPVLKPGTDTFITIRGATHNNVPRKKIYQETMARLLQGI